MDIKCTVDDIHRWVGELYIELRKLQAAVQTLLEEKQSSQRNNEIKNSRAQREEEGEKEG